MRRSNAPRTRSARSRSWYFLALAALASCAPLVPVPPISPDLPRTEPSLRVGILVDTTRVQLGGTTDFEIIRAPTGEVLRRFTAAGPTAALRVGPAGDLIVEAGDATTTAGTMVTVRPVGDGTLLLDGRPYRGTLVVRATGPGRLTVVNHVDMENYLLGVLPHEFGEVGEDLYEALRAQAIAARTYAIRHLGRREALGFDVYATVQDQVYGGAAREYELASRAVYDTLGEIIAFRGEPVEAFYHSTCSGVTANIEEVWLGEEPRPYLTSVVDINPETGEAYDVFSNRFRWTQRWSAGELREIFNRTLADSLPPGVTDVGELRGFETLELTTSGRIKAMRITTENASFVVGSDRIRWVFLTPEDAILNSSRFEIETARDSQGRITEVLAHGMGWGHGIGMCQVGAMGRARAGQDYRTILRAYYRGADVVKLY
jgi:stage II sporulation protein D